MTDFRLTSDIRVELIKHAASDADVISAARVSTMGERAEVVPASPERQKGLINYLMRDRHGSPFEHTSMTFRVIAPIFVFREFHRHRAGWSYNEESARYREIEPVFYVPGPDRKLVQEGKPGQYRFLMGGEDLYTSTYREMAEAYHRSYAHYVALLADGVAREVARMVLPVGVMSTMYATCNARSLMHFLGLRTTHEQAKVPSFPQREIEMVGERMEALWADLMPLTHAAFTDHGRVAP